MRDYQRQKNNKYILPYSVYHQTLWIIRDYHRLKDELDARLTSTPEADGMPKGTDISDPTHNAAVRREKYANTVAIIEKALEDIPSEYRKGVWDNILSRAPFPADADRSTYGRHKSKFVYDVAKKMQLL